MTALRDPATDSEVKVHPAADLFPPMDDETFQQLKADIEKFGQKEPIVFWRQQLIDGRNRLRACQELGIVLSDCELNDEEDPVAYVLSANLHRRHLDPSQKGMVAGRVRDFYAAQAKERQKEQAKRNQPRSQKPVNLPPLETADARDAAGKAVGVSGKSVDAATKVLQSGSKQLIDAVTSGEVSVSKAATVVNEPKKEQLDIATGKRPKYNNPRNDWDTLRGSMERLHRAMGKVYDGWPSTERHALAVKLRAYSDELDESGTLHVSDGPEDQGEACLEWISAAELADIPKLKALVIETAGACSEMAGQKLAAERELGRIITDLNSKYRPGFGHDFVRLLSTADGYRAFQQACDERIAELEAAE